MDHLEVEALRVKVAELERELHGHRAKSDHAYTPHWKEHDGRDSSPFLRVPIYNGRPTYTPNGHLYYRSDNNTLEIQVNGTIKASGAFT